MKQTYYTIEVYNRRKWSDKYSCTYPTLQEAEERARELYGNEVDDKFTDEPIHACYRIKETKIQTQTHELQ
jgi:hypothetical protein